ncbi:NAD(P)-binding domain-containing protein [Streptomyces sp. NPDC001156]
MKVGAIGVGAVGSATMLSLVERGGTCREIVVIDRDSARAAGVAPTCGTPHRCPPRSMCAAEATTTWRTPLSS